MSGVIEEQTSLRIIQILTTYRVFLQNTAGKGLQHSVSHKNAFSIVNVIRYTSLCRVTKDRQTHWSTNYVTSIY